MNFRHRAKVIRFNFGTRFACTASAENNY